jgi:hypothetical protein
VNRRNYCPRSSLRAVRHRTAFLLIVAFAFVLAACGGGQAQTCDELAEQTVELMQQLIDDVEEEVGDTSVEELIATGGGLPSAEGFEEDAEKIDERAEELGCTQSEIQSGVAARANQLEANTPVGQFLIEAIRDGGL